MIVKTGSFRALTLPVRNDRSPVSRLLPLICSRQALREPRKFLPL